MTCYNMLCSYNMKTFKFNILNTFLTLMYAKRTLKIDGLY